MSHGDEPPQLVIWAVALLGLLFLFGGVYLFMTGPFTGTEVMAPAEVPEVTAAVVEYRGTLLGLERARQGVEEAMAQAGLAGGDPITIFPTSPFRMRPIDVRCRLGHLLVIARRVEGLPAPVRLEVFRPGKRLIVRVRGRGNFTGNKAYKAAARFLAPHGSRPADDERYEVKRRIGGHKIVEHWIPLIE